MSIPSCLSRKTNWPQRRNCIWIFLLQDAILIKDPTLSPGPILTPARRDPSTGPKRGARVPLWLPRPPSLPPAQGGPGGGGKRKAACRRSQPGPFLGTTRHQAMNERERGGTGVAQGRRQRWTLKGTQGKDREVDRDREDTGGPINCQSLFLSLPVVSVF